jgi:phosphoglycerate dehydrogenase-like enzyme
MVRAGAEDIAVAAATAHVVAAVPESGRNATGVLGLAVGVVLVVEARDVPRATTAVSARELGWV